MSVPAESDREVIRTNLLRRLTACEPRVLVAVAPAGYGKSTLVRQFANRRRSAISCDCSGAHSVASFAQRIAASLAEGDSDRTQALSHQRLLVGAQSEKWAAFALESWALSSAHELCIFENAERLCDSVEMIAYFARLLARTPERRRLAICSRQPLPLPLRRFFVPDEILTLGTEDLRFNKREIARAFAGIEDSSAAIATIARTTRGWPIAVFLIARLARDLPLRGLFDRIGGVAFSDLFAYLSEQVLAVMSPDRFTALLAVAAVPNATSSDISAALGGQWQHDELLGIRRSFAVCLCARP